MKGRCLDCKNWRRNNDIYLNSFYGECQSDFVYENDWSIGSLHFLDGVAASAPGQYQKELKTGQYFGCIHHFPLPEGETK